MKIAYTFEALCFGHTCVKKLSKLLTASHAPLLTGVQYESVNDSGGEERRFLVVEMRFTAILRSKITCSFVPRLELSLFVLCAEKFLGDASLLLPRAPLVAIGHFYNGQSAKRRRKDQLPLWYKRNVCVRRDAF